MAVKKFTFHFLSAIFSVLVVLANWISACIMLVLAPVSNRSSLANNISQKWLAAPQGKKEAVGYLQIIVNIVIGVICTQLLASYHSFFIETIVSVSFQLHLISLNWVADIPDYSAYLNDSESLKMVAGLLCLVFGYLGLSTLISFMLDLILVFSYPFKVMRTISDRVYASLQKLRQAMIDILTLNRGYWITCTHPSYLMKDTYKIIYICALPLLCSLILLAKVYSIFMSALILISEAIIVLFSLARAWERAFLNRLKNQEGSYVSLLAYKWRAMRFVSVCPSFLKDLDGLQVKLKSWAGDLTAGPK